MSDYDFVWTVRQICLCVILSFGVFINNDCADFFKMESSFVIHDVLKFITTENGFEFGILLPSLTECYNYR